MDETQRKRLFQVGNGVFAIATIVVNILANALPLNNKYTGELSDNLPNLFVPSGITFAIWGIIYVLWLVFVLYSGRDLFSKKQINMPYLDKIHGLFILTCLANMTWIFLWHYEYVVLSLLPMVVLFLSLLLIYQRLEIGKTPATIKDTLCIFLPFSVYLGWITVALIANITGALVSLGYSSLDLPVQQLWTLLILIVGTLIGFLVLWRRKDIGYTLVIVWAYFGILLKRLGGDPMFGVQSTIAGATGILCAILIIGIVFIFILEWKKGFPLLKK